MQGDREETSPEPFHLFLLLRKTIFNSRISSTFHSSSGWMMNLKSFQRSLSARSYGESRQTKHPAHKNAITTTKECERYFPSIPQPEGTPLPLLGRIPDGGGGGRRRGSPLMLFATRSGKSQLPIHGSRPSIPSILPLYPRRRAS